MNSVLRFSRSLLNVQGFITPEVRSISLFPRLQLKEIREVQKEKELVIFAEHLPSPRENILVKNPLTNVCPVCALGEEIKHTDILILSQFVRSDGCMLPRRVTGLCKEQQKRVSTLVTMAQKSGLMPNLNPEKSKKDPRRRFGWKKCNKYFDETTIKIK